MFERLIETKTGSAQKGRRGYFLVSALVLSIALTTGLVVSLFAEELSLGTGNLDMVELIAPVAPPPVEPEPEPQPQMETQPKMTTEAAPKVPTRQVNMARVDESPREAPTTVSTVQNTVKERPRTGYFEIGKADADPAGAPTTGRTTEGGSTGGLNMGDSSGMVAKLESDVAPPPPPPVKKDPPAPKRPSIQSLGVINGKATNLPKPVYSAAAKAIKAEGRVSVRVLIDENGNVVSANAVSGHPMLQSAAESAARRAQFSPTMLSGEPIKISGTIVYNFSI